MCPGDLVVLAALATFLISEDTDAGDLNVIGNFIVSIGSLALTWAAQKENLKSAEESAGNAGDTVVIDNLKEQIKCLEERCEKLETSSSCCDCCNKPKRCRR